jgi:hypothetical protein
VSTPININLGTYSSPAGNFVLNLTAPITTSAGKTYYFLDANGDGSSALVNGVPLDALSHDVLDYLFNFGSDTTASARTVNYTVNGLTYQFRLPTVVEYDALKADSISDPPVGWAPGNPHATYWTADLSGGYHSLYALNDGQVRSGATWPDGTSKQSVAFELVSLPPTTVSFTSTTTSTNEGNSGNQTVTVNASLSTAATTAVTVPITVSGTATANTDYTNAPNSITIPIGSTSWSASFNVVGDTTVESNETVVLTMGTPTGATLGTNTTYTQTITNDDVPTVSFDTTSGSSSEGNSGTQTITVNASLSSVANTGVTVPIIVSGTASSGAWIVISQ